jgi:hypothetical protein
MYTPLEPVPERCVPIASQCVVVVVVVKRSQRLKLPCVNEKK